MCLLWPLPRPLVATHILHSSSMTRGKKAVVMSSFPSNTCQPLSFTWNSRYHTQAFRDSYTCSPPVLAYQCLQRWLLGCTCIFWKVRMISSGGARGWDPREGSTAFLRWRMMIVNKVVGREVTDKLALHTERVQLRVNLHVHTNTHRHTHTL